MAGAPDWLTRQPYAHRGLHDGERPENSRAAFSAAIDGGYGIECDVRLSADGRAMVFHDADLERLTGNPGKTAGKPVGDLTAMMLLGSDETIPTLRDVLAQVAGSVPLLIEIKSDNNTNIQRMCRAVRRDLEGYSENVAIMSFDPRVGRWFAKAMPDLARGLVITEEDARTLSGAVKRRMSVRHAKPMFLAYDIRDLPSRFARAQAKRGLPLLTWTVRSTAHVEMAIKCGAVPILEGAGVAAWDAAS
ncbi:glycerophosphodiester phosphodiesterase family protein [Aurantiacibacter sediminis]|uniref:Glycerophosphodiester phosphodiesterase n=1 Tax=Aurantiacibacter sediminis TaxID=2793064 RepID=A0ABS0N0S8_9SPHN|nr:glycerophosphodiester phosphodiesterase family protein [Aurantiacibacter sediminis]MBH5321572.1 glycerophosphodiester phosphodiesterase [Aurantiacibacter sediminis]